MNRPSSSDIDEELFSKLTNLSNKLFKKFEQKLPYDTKEFTDKIRRDYHKEGKRGDYVEIALKDRIGRFPVHILRTIQLITDSQDYDYIVFILRGSIPFSIIFRAYGWDDKKLKYVFCGRPDRKTYVTNKSQQVYRDVDESIDDIKNKRVLIVDNNLVKGSTAARVLDELKKKNIQYADLLIDYVCGVNNANLNEEEIKNKNQLSGLRKLIIAVKTKVEDERKIKDSFLERIIRM